MNTSGGGGTVIIFVRKIKSYKYMREEFLIIKIYIEYGIIMEMKLWFQTMPYNETPLPTLVQGEVVNHRNKLNPIL